MPCPVLSSMFDGLVPAGLQPYWKANVNTELTDAAIEGTPAARAGPALGQLDRAHLTDQRSLPSRRGRRHGVPLPGRRLDVHRGARLRSLGLTPTMENDEFVRLSMSSGTWFQLYETAYAGTGKHTIAALDVEDLASTVAELTAAGVSSGHHDMPGVTRDGSVAEFDGSRVAWFTDSEGNILCLDERITG